MLPGGIIPSDQMNQRESRIYFGGRAEQSWFNKVAGFDMSNTLGVQVRNDLNRVLLNNSNQGVVYRNVSGIRLRKPVSAYICKTRLTGYQKSELLPACVAIYLNFDVHAFTIPQNSGNKTDGLVSPKLRLFWAPGITRRFTLMLAKATIPTMRAA